MVLVANKVDLVHLRKITSDQGKEMAMKHSVGASLPLHNTFILLILSLSLSLSGSSWLCMFYGLTFSLTL